MIVLKAEWYLCLFAVDVGGFWSIGFLQYCSWCF